MKKKHNQGFSLVELILAIAILAIIMVAIGSFMNSTTRVYNRTKNSIEVAQTSQDLYDLISDKIMQAKEIRIGRGGEEYAILDTVTTHSFDELTKEETNVEYICIYYDAAVGTQYGSVIDVYYFHDKKVYLTRQIGVVRSSSYYDNSGETDPDAPKKTSSSDGSEADVSTSMDTCISNIKAMSLTDLEEYLVCENVESFYIYAIPDENALYMQVDVEKKGRESMSEGMVTIRNSYVLAPKNTGSGS